MTGLTDDSKKEVKAQGLAIVVTIYFGGPTGCAMIGRQSWFRFLQPL